MTISIDISQKINDPITVELLDKISKIAADLDIPLVIVGATARDIVLWHGFNIPPTRATRDIDLGVRVASWAQFETLKESLTASGQFQPQGQKCRMVFKGEMPVDLLPFGLATSPQHIVEWPPSDGEQLNMLGFEETYETAMQIRIRDEPDLVVRVANPAALVLMKIIAWNDRRPVDKDAIDLGILIRTYLQLGNSGRLVADHNDLIDDDFDYEKAGAHLLGRDLRRICQPETKRVIFDILTDELAADSELPLVVGSSTSSSQIDRTKEFWVAILSELE